MVAYTAARQQRDIGIRLALVSIAALTEQTDGATALGGKHLREGVVVRPATERDSAEFGRVILKSVSGNYLTRKGGTEYN